MGRIVDTYAVNYVEEERHADDRQRNPQDERPRRVPIAVNVDAIKKLPESSQQAEIANAAQADGYRWAFRWVALMPVALVVLFSGIFLYDHLARRLQARNPDQPRGRERASFRRHARTGRVTGVFRSARELLGRIGVDSQRCARGSGIGVADPICPSADLPRHRLPTPFGQRFSARCSVSRSRPRSATTPPGNTRLAGRGSLRLLAPAAGAITANWSHSSKPIACSGQFCSRQTRNEQLANQMPRRGGQQFHVHFYNVGRAPHDAPRGQVGNQAVDRRLCLRPLACSTEPARRSRAGCSPVPTAATARGGYGCA